MPHSTTAVDFISRFERFIKENQLIAPHETTLLAVSGGVDSVVMVDLFYRSHIPFAIAHCNFGLRAKESDEDEQWVTKVANDYGVRLYVNRFSTKDYATKNHLSIQLAARKLRYKWFDELCEQYHLQKMATAHHTNDMLETLLFNITKGTGLAGLHGISPQQGKLIRPLLFATKDDILTYAQAQHLFWHEDSSNAKSAYARNLIRNQVVPILKSINPNLEKTIYTTIQRIGQVELLLKEQLEILQKTIVRHQDDVMYLTIQPIKDKPWAPVVLWEMLKPFGFNFTQIQTLWHSCSSSGKMIKSTTHQLYVDRANWLLMPHQKSSLPVVHSIEKNKTYISLPSYNLQLTLTPLQQYSIVADYNIAALDMAKLKFPLVVRTWQAGDFFYPIGMQHSKKVSDFMIDQKINVVEKAKVLVLVSDCDIAWIIGHRIDNRFKVTAGTTHVYEVKLMKL